MSSFLRERIYVFSPVFLYSSVSGKLAKDYPDWAGNKLVVHDFISWSIKKAFMDITGFHVDGFREDVLTESFYSIYKQDFESFMFDVSREMGNHLSKDSLSFNIVLTYDRLYCITY